ncbi:MAG: hypothetical protein H6835_15905 [Planctomycetes bacterium]|nr:hypothetical protein [Planctomycetota bacterium]
MNPVADHIAAAAPTLHPVLVDSSSAPYGCADGTVMLATFVAWPVGWICAALALVAAALGKAWAWIPATIAVGVAVLLCVVVFVRDQDQVAGLRAMGMDPGESWDCLWHELGQTSIVWVPTLLGGLLALALDGFRRYYGSGASGKIYGRR